MIRDCTKLGVSPTQHRLVIGIASDPMTSRTISSATNCFGAENLRALRGQPDTKTVPAWKRALDLLFILLAAPLLLPLGLLIAAGIKILSPGPAIFTQHRVGFLGRRFRCLKFRTMVVNADTGMHQGHFTRLMSTNRPMTKLDSAGDPRLIPCGRLMRALGLDELPQVINVLRGEMSLIGPRPCLPYEYERYLPRHRERFETLPGLTGLWQVNGKNRTTFEQMMDLDIYYARNKSFGLDLKILAKTIPAILVQTRDLKRKQSSLRLTPLLGRLSTGQSLERSY